MLIGMTYDLLDDYIAEGFTAEQAGEFDPPECIETIDNALRVNGFEVERIGNIKALVNSLATGKRWDMIFNIAEGVKGLAREAQIPALLEAYDIPTVFSPANVMQITLDKSLAKHIVRSHGINTPDFILVYSAEDLDSVDLPYPLFVKPVGEGSSKGVHATSCVKNETELRNVCLRLIKQFDQPVLVETYLPGREFTVCVLGTGHQASILAIGEISMKPGGDKDVYTYRNKIDCFDNIVLYNGSLAKVLAEVALTSWRVLRCCDCGRIDIRLSSDGVPNFLEINTLPGLRPGYSELPMLAKEVGLTYEDLLGKIVRKALSRYGLRL